MSNKLDQSIKLLKDHKTNLEREVRETQRAIARIDRAITALGTPTNGRRVPHPNYKGPKGPIRRDSHIIMMDAIRASFAPGHNFTRRQAVELITHGSNALRPGQASGAVDTLVEMGWLQHPGHNQYNYEK